MIDEDPEEEVFLFDPPADPNDPNFLPSGEELRVWFYERFFQAKPLWTQQEFSFLVQPFGYLSSARDCVQRFNVEHAVHSYIDGEFDVPRAMAAGILPYKSFDGVRYVEPLYALAWAAQHLKPLPEGVAWLADQALGEPTAADSSYPVSDAAESTPDASGQASDPDPDVEEQSRPCEVKQPAARVNLDIRTDDFYGSFVGPLTPSEQNLVNGTPPKRLTTLQEEILRLLGDNCSRPAKVIVADLENGGMARSVEAVNDALKTLRSLSYVANKRGAGYYLTSLGKSRSEELRHPQSPTD